MSQGVVFKQRYKSRNIPTTPTLNRKHLAYIATRPGAVHNPGCAFGLWGRLPGIQEPENIDNLKMAKKTVFQASKQHTLYRAVISVDGDTAKRHDLHSRKSWEELVNHRINVLADEMGIKRKDFCWMASMHYVKSHPHVHIMYWDNSDAVRQEYIPEKRFEIMAERVRSEFGREIYQEEIREQQDQQDDNKKALRLELRALLKDANLAEALDLSHVSKPMHSELTKAFAELATTAPTKGSIDYAYLSKHPEYKEKLDAFIGEVLKISDFQKILKGYEAATKEIGAFYGNGKERQEYELKKARENVYKSLGNEVMSTIREYRKELAAEIKQRGELETVIRTTAVAIAKTNPLYQELRKAMPKERTPIGALMQDEGFRKPLGKLTGQICDDIRINARIRGYLDAAIAKNELDKEAAKELTSEVYKDARQSVAKLILDQLREDAGYQQQYQADLVTNLLIRLLGDASRGSGQQQAQRDLLRHRRDLSKTAQRDRKAQREQGGAWQGMEL